MQPPITKHDIDPIPDEETFRQALLQIERFGKLTHDIAVRQKEFFDIEKDRHEKETSVLKKRLEDKERELETQRKSIIDVRMELSEARRNDNSLKLEIKQLKEQIEIYKVDGGRIEEAERLLRATREENAALRARIEALGVEAARAARDHKTEIDSIELSHEKEKIQLSEKVQVAEEKARAATDTIERYKSLAALAESEKAAAVEEMERSRSEQKRQTEKLRSSLAQSEAALSEHDRVVADLQYSYERKLALARSQAEQTYQAEIEKLKHAGEDQLHELARTRYQMEQMQEDHRRAVAALKQDMEKQISLRADEIRRQLILKSSGTPGNDPS